MDAKLTPELDQAAIAEATAAGVVAELAGVLKGAEIGDPRDEYAEYLLEKYS